MLAACTGGVVAASFVCAATITAQPGSSRAPERAAAPRPQITWEGTITVRDRYTHDYSQSSGGNSCFGAVVTTITTRYTVTKSSGVVTNVKQMTTDAKYALDQEVSTMSGSVQCFIESCDVTRTSTIDSSGDFQTIYGPFGGEMRYWADDKKLEFASIPGERNGERDIVFGGARFVAASPCPGDTGGALPDVHVGGSGGPRLEVGGQGDFRLPVTKTRDPKNPNKELLRVNGTFGFQLSGGNPGRPANGLPIGNFSNFSAFNEGTLGTKEVSLTETVTADLRGTVDEVSVRCKQAKWRFKAGWNVLSAATAKARLFTFEPRAVHCWDGNKAWFRSSDLMMDTPKSLMQLVLQEAPHITFYTDGVKVRRGSPGDPAVVEFRPQVHGCLDAKALILDWTTAKLWRLLPQPAKSALLKKLPKLAAEIVLRRLQAGKLGAASDVAADTVKVVIANKIAKATPMILGSAVPFFKIPDCLRIPIADPAFTVTARKSGDSTADAKGAFGGLWVVRGT